MCQFNENTDKNVLYGTFLPFYECNYWIILYQTTDLLDSRSLKVLSILISPLKFK